MTFRTWRRGALCQCCILGSISVLPKILLRNFLALQNVQTGLDLVTSTQAYCEVLLKISKLNTFHASFFVLHQSFWLFSSFLSSKYKQLHLFLFFSTKKTAKCVINMGICGKKVSFFSYFPLKYWCCREHPCRYHPLYSDWMNCTSKSETKRFKTHIWRWPDCGCSRLDWSIQTQKLWLPPRLSTSQTSWPKLLGCRALEEEEQTYRIKF